MTDVTTSADYAALLRGVCEEPDSDLPRLVLADYLDDHADEPHHIDYAEFVRLQCELGGRPPRDYEWYAPRVARVHDLLASHETAWSRPWRTTAVVRAERSRNGCCDRYGDMLSCNCLADAPEFGWPRGFVGRVMLTQAQFVGGDCGSCHGSGRLMIHHRTHGDCLTCEGVGRTAGLAAALFNAYPIVCVTLSDRAPHADALLGGYFWTNIHNMTVPSAADLHPALFSRLHDSGFASFATLADAYAALSSACVAHGRPLAGLPPLPVGDAVPV